MLLARYLIQLPVSSVNADSREDVVIYQGTFPTSSAGQTTNILSPCLNSFLPHRHWSKVSATSAPEVHTDV